MEGEIRDARTGPWGGLSQDGQAYGNPSIGVPLLYPGHLPMTGTVWPVAGLKTTTAGSLIGWCWGRGDAVTGDLI